MYIKCFEKLNKNILGNSYFMLVNYTVYTGYKKDILVPRKGEPNMYRPDVASALIHQNLFWSYRN